MLFRSGIVTMSKVRRCDPSSSLSSFGTGAAATVKLAFLGLTLVQGGSAALQLGPFGLCSAAEAPNIAPS